MPSSLLSTRPLHVYCTPPPAPPLVRRLQTTLRQLHTTRANRSAQLGSAQLGSAPLGDDDVRRTLQLSRAASLAYLDGDRVVSSPYYAAPGGLTLRHIVTDDATASSATIFELARDGTIVPPPSPHPPPSITLTITPPLS